MDRKKQTIKNIFWSAIQNWGGQIGSLIVFLVLARLLTPKAWGLLALANITIDFMQIFLHQGFVQAIIQKRELQAKQINTIFIIQVLLSCLFTLLVYFSAGMIAIAFDQPELKLVLQVLSILFIISAFSQTPTALLWRQMAFRALAIRALVAIIVAGIVGVCFALMGYGVWSLVAQQLTYETVSVICLWKASNWRPKWQFAKDYLPELSSFTLSMLGSRLVNFFNQKTDNLLIGYFLGDVALGYYAIAHRILQVMTQLLIGTLNQVILPIFARLQKNKTDLLKTFYRATQYTCLITLPTFVGTIILGEELIITLFGQKWSDTVPIIQILCLTGILRGILFFQRSVFIALGKPSLQLKIGICNALFNVIACCLAIRWGMIAVAIAYVISDYLVFPLSLRLLMPLINLALTQYLKKFIAPLTCTLIMALTMILFKEIFIDNFNYPLQLVVNSLIGVVIFVFSLKCVFPQLFSDLLIMVKQIKI